MTNQQQTTISPELRDFLQSWLDWVEAGAPDKQPYRRTLGLCTNTGYYKTDGNQYNNDDELYEELSKFFDCGHPFGLKEYFQCKKDRSMHLDHNRIAWVKEKLK